MRSFTTSPSSSAGTLDLGEASRMGAFLAQLAAGWRVLARNRLALVGGAIIMLGVVVALFAPILATHDPYAINPARRLQGPSAEHWFGTDYLGRDTFSRIVFGARSAFQVALGAVFIGSVVGIPLGAIAGYFGRYTDGVVMRIMDTLLAFPGRLLAIALVAVLGGGLVALYVAIGVSSIPHYARIVRGVVLAQKEREYVGAAQLAGENHFRILFSEILPNCTAPLIVALSLDFAHAILIESSLSFLGLGFPPPTPSWGLMLKDVTPYLELQPLAAFFPGVAISLIILGFNLFGDGLRDAFDPRHHQG